MVAALDNLYYPDKADDFDVDKKEAALPYAAGADGIYTYNYFDINHKRFDVLGSPDTLGPADPAYDGTSLKIYSGGNAYGSDKFVTIK